MLQFKVFGQQNAELIGNPSTPANSMNDDDEVVLVSLEKLEKEAVEVLILYCIYSPT